MHIFSTLSFFLWAASLLLERLYYPLHVFFVWFQPPQVARISSTGLWIVDVCCFLLWSHRRRGWSTLCYPQGSVCYCRKLWHPVHLIQYNILRLKVSDMGLLYVWPRAWCGCYTFLLTTLVIPDQLLLWPNFLWNLCLTVLHGVDCVVPIITFEDPLDERQRSLHQNLITIWFSCGRYYNYLWMEATVSVLVALLWPSCPCCSPNWTSNTLIFCVRAVSPLAPRRLDLPAVATLSHSKLFDV